jgi:hypothetical protein
MRENGAATRATRPRTKEISAAAEVWTGRSGEASNSALRPSSSLGKGYADVT